VSVDRSPSAGPRYYDCPSCDAEESLEDEHYTDAHYIVCGECGAVIEAYEWDDEEPQ
jgi:transcription elongation factor Elf1